MSVIEKVGFSFSVSVRSARNCASSLDMDGTFVLLVTFLLSRIWSLYYRRVNRICIMTLKKDMELPLMVVSR